ncbi:MAG: phosphoglycerate dehydrogenase-like oxidoreductase [Verrucomicrobiales bacterium]|nr:phosphoglycerate dehydrogenase-like oxidoreductase [Verrucomicrobiales bacterium]
MKAIRTDRELECPRVDAGLRARGLTLVTLPEGVGEEQLIAEVADADLLLMCYTPITARVISAAPRLRGIIKYGVGIDAIDIEAARRCHIPVVNVPEYAEETVAEGAFALMIALARKLGPLHCEMKNSGWAWPIREWLGNDLAGKTLGLIGVGKIGRSLARMADAGFRMRVLGFDPFVDEETMRRAGVEKCGRLSDLLPLADFVSLHAVLNLNTRRLIGPAEFEQMKASATLINVSRGALVDEAALVDALLSGRIAGAGLDVFSEEPLSLSGHPLSRLFALPNVILTPHITFYTEEAMERLEQETLERCDELLAGRPVLIKSHDPRLRGQSHGVVFT